MLPKKVKEGQACSARAHNLLLDHVRSITPRGDLKTIQVKTTPGGTFISRIGSLFGGGGKSSAGNDYTGFFRLVESEDQENTIEIIDGTGTLSGKCGIFVSGIDKIEVIKKSLTITAESYIMLYATYNAEGKKWTIEIKAESSIPDFSEDKFTALLGIVKWDSENEKMGQVVQIWNNGIIYNNRYS